MESNSAPRDALLVLLPPPDMVQAIIAGLRAREKRGDTVPDHWWAWLARVQDVRTGQPVYALDCLTAEEWQELVDLVF